MNGGCSMTFSLAFARLQMHNKRMAINVIFSYYFIKVIFRLGVRLGQTEPDGECEPGRYVLAFLFPGYPFGHTAYYTECLGIQFRRYSPHYFGVSYMPVFINNHLYDNLPLYARFLCSCRIFYILYIYAKQAFIPPGNSVACSTTSKILFSRFLSEVLAGSGASSIR